MSDLLPTAENLNDPYVIQLIEALSWEQDRIEELFKRIAELEAAAGTTRIDQYICIDLEKELVREMREIIAMKMKDQAYTEDRKWLREMKKAAKVIIKNYTV